jgi:hypothetical protein
VASMVARFLPVVRLFVVGIAGAACTGGPDDVAPSFPFGPSCPASSGGIAGVSQQCSSCVTVHDDHLGCDPFWSCFCACAVSDSQCRQQCLGRFVPLCGAFAGEALNDALGACESDCAGQQLHAVPIPGGGACD